MQTTASGIGWPSLNNYEALEADLPEPCAAVLDVCTRLCNLCVQVTYKRGTCGKVPYIAVIEVVRVNLLDLYIHVAKYTLCDI